MLGRQRLLVHMQHFRKIDILFVCISNWLSSQPHTIDPDFPRFIVGRYPWGMQHCAPMHAGMQKLASDMHHPFNLFVCLMVLNATFNNISAISWRSVLLVEETGRPGQNHRPVASHGQTLFTLMLYTSPRLRFELTASAVIATDYIGSCKSNYHTITVTTTPFNLKSSVQCIDRYRLRSMHMFDVTCMFRYVIK